MLFCRSRKAPSRSSSRKAACEPTRGELPLSVLLPLLLLLLFGFWLTGFPSAATEPTDKTPQGRRAWMHVVFRHDKDVVSKNSVGGVDPARAARWARRQGVLSFGYLFFARAKKSDPLPRSGSGSFCSCFELCSCFEVFKQRPTAQNRAEAEATAGSRAFAPLRGASYFDQPFGC